MLSTVEKRTVLQKQRSNGVGKMKKASTKRTAPQPVNHVSIDDRQLNDLVERIVKKLHESTDIDGAAITDDAQRERWVRTCRLLAHQIEQGNFDAAREILEDFIRYTPQKVSMDAPIFSLPDVPYRVLAMLENEGYKTIRAVAFEREDRLLSLPLIERKTLKLIKDSVRKVSSGRVRV